MYYEVYVDVLFVENLWVNVCLLLLTSRLMGYQTDRKRIAAGAALGSMGACLLETGSAYLTTAGWFLGTILTAAVMIRTAYGKRNTYIKCLVVLYLEGWLLGGTVRYLEQFYVLAGFMLAGGSMVLAGILLAVQWVLVKLREREDTTGNDRVEFVMMQDGQVYCYWEDCYWKKGEEPVAMWRRVLVIPDKNRVVMED